MSNVGVHQTHCCDKHGCKYGHHKTCPVVTGKVKQEYPCQTCGETGQGEGDFYEQGKGKLVWHPPIREVVVRVAKQLGPKGKGKLSPKALRDLNFLARQITDGENEEFLRR